ncbi:transcriptional regulator [Pseudoroseomonas aestuarii]|uniref:Transcriptional regulator n=1 Tax=Teichococcus aestuarii TaxID=568898 RepID=A0A2U1UZ93_9PROT|nr:transcriptional regulator [Pseudoroseomonas aestuarii]
MARTDEKVRDLPRSKRVEYTAETAAQGVQNVIRVLEGRWKLVILFQLFGGQVRRFSDLERAIPGVSQKMLIQQLRQLEGDGVVARIVHHQVPPKVEYHLTAWGQALCPALDALLMWAESTPSGLRSRPVETVQSD